METVRRRRVQPPKNGYNKGISFIIGRRSLRRSRDGKGKKERSRRPLQTLNLYGTIFLMNIFFGADPPAILKDGKGARARNKIIILQSVYPINLRKGILTQRGSRGSTLVFWRRPFLVSACLVFKRPHNGGHGLGEVF